MRRLYQGLALVVLGAAALAVAIPSQAQVTALTGATVIDGNGGAPIHNGVIVIDGKRLVAVGPAASVSIPAGARRIDVSGQYVVPGLMDANVHLIPWPSWTYIEFLARYENQFDAIIEEAAQIALKHGFTTVFDSMGPLAPLMRVRDRINRGEIEGARMYVAGDIVGFRAVFTTPESMKSATPAFQKRINDLFELNVGQDLPWKSPEQVKEEMRRYVARGVDFVKYGATGDGNPTNSEIGEDAVLRFTPEQQRAMIEAVHEAGKIIQTHQTSAESLRIVVEAGVDMAQHCALTGPSRISEATIQVMLKRHFYCGTQWGVLTPAQERQVRENKFPGSDADNGKEGVDYGLENEIRLIKAGVPELVSTDAGTIDPDVAAAWRSGQFFAFGGFGSDPGLAQGGSNTDHGEADSQVQVPEIEQIGDAEFTLMRGMSQRGMTPMMILQAATKNIAAAYHKLDSIGTLEKGKMADLVVVEANPLADIQNLRRVALIMKEGQVIQAEQLPRHPVLTSQEALHPGAVRTR